MSVLDRSALEESPLADLHAIASELGIDGYRRLRKAELVDSIIARQGGDAAAVEDAETAVADAKTAVAEDTEAVDEDAGTTDEGDTGTAEEDRPRRTRGRRGGRRRTRADADDAADGDDDDVTAAATGPDEDDADADADAGRGPSRRRRGGGEAGADDDAEERPSRSSRGQRGRGRRAATGAEDADEREPARRGEEERTAEGTIELLGNGSGFVRVAPPEPSDDDVYVSAAQVRRCELVAGDTVSGPVRPPRRSERYASLIRVDTINGRPADEVAEGTRFEDLPAAFPTERIAPGSDDPTVKAIEWLTPIGKGSRVALIGPAHAGKSEAVRRLAAALDGIEGLDVTVVLAGARPEEIAEWQAGPVTPLVAVPFTASGDAQAQAVERGVEQAKRLAARGADAVLLVDSLAGLAVQGARRALGAARNIVDGGSLTIIATAPEPLGGETTIVALDPTLASTGRFPALDLTASGTLRPELLVGEAGAEAIAKARLDALGVEG